MEGLFLLKNIDLFAFTLSLQYPGIHQHYFHIEVNTASALLSRRPIGHSATRCVGSQVNRTLSNMKTHRFSGLFFDLYGTILVYGDMKMAWKEWFDSIRESLKGFGVKVEKDCLRKICTGFFSKPEPPMDGVKEPNAV